MSSELRCATDQALTRLRCAQCDTPICPRCMERTPVGLRCRSCGAPANSATSVRSRRGSTRALAGAVIVLVAIMVGVVVAGSFDSDQQAADGETVADAAPAEATPGLVINAALTALENDYVFPDVAEDMVQAIRANEDRGDYAGLDGEALAQRLTEDLQAVSEDKHLQVIFSPRSGPPGLPPGAGPPRPPGEADHGIARVEVLPGNVGLIEMHGFVPPTPPAKDAIAEAMTAVRSTDALIFDMRENGGGKVKTVALVLSYLLGPEPRQVTSFYDGDGDVVDEFHTSADLAGPRYGDRDVYVLTSERTFSGAEHFAYDLKHFGRATIVGEPTGGGANPTRPVRLPANFEMRLPYAQALNPTTQANWEGTGVQPDLDVPAAEALDTAIDAAQG